jgi:hypothetical protein
VSDTPKTDAFEALVDRPINWWNFARQLERENAALRAEVEAERNQLEKDRVNFDLLDERNKLLGQLATAERERDEEQKRAIAARADAINAQRENAALRADKERLDWVIKDSYYHFFFKLSSDLEKGRRQIDAARKEVQS